METLKPPPALNLEGGNVAESFRRWKQRYILYMEATGATGKEKKQQCSILLHVIGEDALEVYNTFGLDGTDPDAVLQTFEDYCNPLKNVTYERHKFFTRTQAPGETIDQYVTDLKTKSKSCEFGDLCDSLIKDRIVCGINNDQVRERLLREQALTLTKAVEVCRASEMSKSQIKSIVDHNEDHKQVIHAVDKKQGRQPFKTNNFAPRGRGRGRESNYKNAPKPETTGKCKQCGTNHKGRVCPAQGKECYKCKKRNHFASVCTNRPTKVSVLEKTNDEFLIGTVNSSTLDENEWQTSLKINGHHYIKFKLDTGAQANVISENLYNKIKPRGEELKRTNVRLTTYSNEKIPVLGSTTAKCHYKGKDVVLNFLVVRVDSQPVLGLHACQNVLKLVQRVNIVQNNTSVLDEYADVFSSQGPLGCLQETYHIVIDPTVQSVVHPPRRVPIALQNRVHDELKRMEQNGIIEKVEEPTEWVNSMVIVEKPNGSLRICLDPKDLNNAIKREHFPMPTSDEVSSMLNGAKYFSKLDASSGFWQIPLDDESSKLCTFNTPEGRYKFLRMPFGISSAPEVFHRTVHKMLEGIDGVVSIIDDILVWGSSKEEYDFRLRSALDRIRQGSLKLNREKCKIGLEEVTYFGHTYSAEGRSPDKNKVEAVVSMPVPTCKKDLERFLGMVTYIAKFVPSYSSISSPLRVIIKKDVPWQWGPLQEEAFKKLKVMVTSAPVLRYFDSKKSVTLSVDASQNGLGAVILQEDGPVEYASRSLTETEKGYAQIEKEMLAIVFGCERFHQYIYGRNVTVESDHKPLEIIMKKPLSSAPARLQRFMLRLQKYQISLVYKPGREMYIADQLSRAYLNTDLSRNEGLQDEVQAQIHMMMRNLPISPEKLLEFQEAMNDDHVLQTLKQVVKEGWPELRTDVPQNIRVFWPYRDEITEAEKLLFKGDKLIVPHKLRNEMLRRIHSCHLGIEKSRLRARDILFWPGISADIEEHVSSCETCNKFQKSNAREPLKPHAVPQRPWQKVGIDLFMYKNGTYLIVVDYFSKFVEIALLKNDTKSSTVITHLKSIFARHGIPDEVMSDNGPQFGSSQFQTFSKEWEFRHTTSSPRYPRSNGMVERSVQTVKNLLKKADDDGKDPYLAILEYRNTPVNENGSPAQLLMSRRLKTLLPVTSTMLMPKVVENVEICLKNRQAKQKFYYDQGTKQLPKLENGQNVRVQSDDKKQWFPATVVRTESPRSYVVQGTDGTVLRRNRVQIRPSNEHFREIGIPEDKLQDVVPVSNSCENTDSKSSMVSESRNIVKETILNKPINVGNSVKSCNSEVVTRSGRHSSLPTKYQDFHVYKLE